MIAPLGAVVCTYPLFSASIIVAVVVVRGVGGIRSRESQGETSLLPRSGLETTQTVWARRNAGAEKDGLESFSSILVDFPHRIDFHFINVAGDGKTSFFPFPPLRRFGYSNQENGVVTTIGRGKDPPLSTKKLQNSMAW